MYIIFLFRAAQNRSIWCLWHYWHNCTVWSARWAKTSSGSPPLIFGN